MKNLEPNLVRVGWRGVGYEVSAGEAQRHHRFQWIAFSLIVVPAIFVMIRYGQHHEPLLPISPFWWEFGVMAIMLVFVVLASRLVNQAYLARLCRGKDPYDIGSAFLEQRRKRSEKNWKTIGTVFWVITAAVISLLVIGEPSGTITCLWLMYAIWSSEALFFRYFSVKAEEG